MQAKVFLLSICPFCCEILNNPIVLPCSHSFCMKCAESFLAIFKLTLAVPYCPECGLIMSFFPHHKSWLIKNKVFAKLLNGPPLMVCQACKENSEFLCRNCKIFFCENCANRHTMNKYAYHVIESVKNYKNCYCIDHGYKKNFFCMKDGLALCIRCVNSHKTHEIEDFCTAETVFMKEIKEIVLFLQSIQLFSQDSSNSSDSELLTFFISTILIQSQLKILQYCKNMPKTFTISKNPSADMTPDMFYLQRTSFSLKKYRKDSSVETYHLEKSLLSK